MQHPNLNYHLHSDKEKIDKNTNVYLVDTYGDTNLFFNTCKNIFIGKSLTVDGGQNPLEPARHNCTIIHGPHVSNFTEIYNYLDKKKISFKIQNEKFLYSKLKFFISKKNNSNNVNKKLNMIGSEILNKNFKKIMSLI